MEQQAADYFSGITPGILPKQGVSTLLHLGVCSMPSTPFCTSLRATRQGLKALPVVVAHQ